MPLEQIIELHYRKQITAEAVDIIQDILKEWGYSSGLYMEIACELKKRMDEKLPKL